MVFFRTRKSRTEKMMEWVMRMFSGIRNMFKRLR